MRETPGQSQSLQTTHSPFPRKYTETAAHLSEPLDKVRYHTSCLHYLFEFHVWHPEQSPVNHTDIQFTRNWWLATSLAFLSRADALFIFFFVIPDSSSLHSDIANYFKLSGRQFSISIKSRLLPPTLGRGNGGLCSQPRNSYGCHLRINLNSIFSPTSEDTRWVHPLVKTQVCSLYVFQ